MTAFLDTSALYAALDRDDAHHTSVAPRLRRLLGEERLVTTSYVVVESTALVQRRLGSQAVRDLHTALLPAVDTIWVDEGLHQAGVIAMLGSVAGDVSLVDHVSFELMRARGISTALTVDRHFADAGFTVVP